MEGGMYKFSIGDLVSIDSRYIDSEPPNLGIVVGIRYSVSMIEDVVFYKVAIWGLTIEFIEEELILASEHTKTKPS